MPSPLPRPRVFLDVNIGEQPAGRLTIELFADQVPRTAENFRQFCTGEHDGLTYAKTPFHRVIDEFMLQGGDIEHHDGTGSVSIYGRQYADENLGWRDIDAAGLVCSANRGQDTNGSQFFITLVPCPHLAGKHTVLGRLVSGEDTLGKIGSVKTDPETDVPLEPVLISRCGELERRKKVARPPLDPSAMASSHDRGRRRRSASGDVEMDNSPVPPSRPHQHRRTSDNAVDEGIRGRPRQRSGSRSPSRPLSPAPEDDSSSSDRGSPASKHKRKRSPSPSRHADGSGHYGRRRRSLPNQYDERKSRMTSTEDEARYRPSPRRDDHRHRGGQKRDRDSDRYRPGRDRHRGHADDGRLADSRLGGSGSYDSADPPVKFKGRGVMKYREPDRSG